MQRRLHTEAINLMLCLLVVGSAKGNSNDQSFVSGGAFVLNESYSSVVFNETQFRSDMDCVSNCRMRGCAVASVNDVSGLCQLIVLNDASKALGPPGTHVRRVVGAEAGDRVWKAQEFEEQMMLLGISAMHNITVVFNKLQNGTSGTDSVPFSSIKKGFGGVDGQPGFTYTPSGDKHGGSGAGWLGKANMTRKASNNGDRGGGRADGWIGGAGNEGAVGGFGGGGGGGRSNGASGGGGGFSGGGSGVGGGNAGGGGGSFCGGSGCAGTTGGNADSEHGSVVLQLAGLSCG